jgi:hypothetical protein
MHVEQRYVRHGVLGKALQFGAGGERGRTQAVLRQAFGDRLPLECLVFDQNDLCRNVQPGCSLVCCVTKCSRTIQRSEAARHWIP